MKALYIFTLFFFFSIGTSVGQGIVKKSISSDTNTPFVGCGSHELFLKMDAVHPGVLEGGNAFLKEVEESFSSAPARSADDLYRVPVVFHVLHNTTAEDIPDSVLIQQLAILNASYRRENSDTINLRSEFLNHVGDSKIEFYLATLDPDGNVTNGVVHKQTTVTNFGGILPYGPNQTALIQQWVTDSLFYNYFSMTKDSLGGDDAWDVTKYLNIWIGDLTILEPQFNNIEELVFFGLSTPPITHPNWPAATIQQFAGLGDGTLMHYKAIGPNNPAPFVGSYSAYNGIANTGKMLVHEVGHYLGLRHIWGDGDCTEDDYVSDTPRASAASQYDCNKVVNSCADTINGIDLPNMVENYMDYSEGDCQNSFTQGQVAVMRATLENFRNEVFLISVEERAFSEKDIKLYPNPTHGSVEIEFSELLTQGTIQVLGLTGAVLKEQRVTNVQKSQVNLPATSGIYFVRIISGAKIMTIKVVKR